MTPRERADRAQQLLNDPVLNHAYDDIRERMVAKMEQIDATDIEAQHTLVMSLQLLKALRLQLSRYSEEVVMDNAIARNQSWIKRAKSLMP